MLILYHTGIFNLVTACLLTLIYYGTATEPYDTLTDYDRYEYEPKTYERGILDVSDGTVRIRTQNAQRFLEGLMMEAGRHVLYPDKQPSKFNDIEEVNVDEPLTYDHIGQPEYIDLGMQRTQRASVPPVSHECSRDCPNFEPVCSNEGKAYDSECHLLRENCRLPNVTVSSWENCRGKHHLCPSACLDINDPVCGQDGRIYHNMCIMRKRNCGKLLEIQPLKFCYTRRQGKLYETCPEDCQEIYEPVCGSDGAIYYNDCFLKMKTCGSDVNVVKLEHCAQISRCPEMCLPIYDPVCGSDGKLYINHCRMLQENCENDIKRMPRNFCGNIRRDSSTARP